MSRCHFCNTNVLEGIHNCPVCFRSLNIDKEENNKEYPQYNKMDKSILSFGLKILLFIFISSTLISFLINILLNTNNPWSLIVFASFLYIWILIKITITGKTSYGAKLLLQLLGLSLLILVINIIANEYFWSINYVIPFLIIISNSIISIKIVSKRIKWRNYSIFQIILLFIGCIPIILYSFNVITILWPSLASFVYTVLTFIAFIIFSPIKFKQELLKIFHM